jgi:hypothetical protein
VVPTELGCRVDTDFPVEPTDVPSGSDALLTFHGHRRAKAFDLEQMHQARNTGDACGADIFHGQGRTVAGEIECLCEGMQEYISTM